MTSVFKRTMVAGINHGLEKMSKIAWPSATIAEDEICKLADNLAGPDMLPEGGLSRGSAVKIANALIERASEYGRDPKMAAAMREYGVQAKTASSRDLNDVAFDAAVTHMRKVADAALIIAGGEQPNTLAEAAKTDALAKLDVHNRAPGEYMVAPGQTKMPKGGVIGEELAHPKAPPTSPALSSSVAAKVAADAAMIQAGLDALPANMKTAALAALTSDDEGVSTKMAEKLKLAGGQLMGKNPRHAKHIWDKVKKPLGIAAGATAVGGAGLAAAKASKKDKDSEKKANADPAALLEMLSHPQGHPEVEGKIPPEVAELIMQLLSGQQGGAPAPGPEMGGAPGMGAPPPPVAPEAPAGGAEGHPEPDGDEGEEKDAAAVLAFLDKVAEGGSLTDSEPNTLASAAKTDALSKLDLHNRAEGEYEVAQGKTEMPNAGHVGSKKDVADKPEHPDTTPVREQAKSAAEAEYVARVSKIAHDVLPQLPSTMSHAEKIATLKRLAGPSPAEQAELLKGLRA
jgi:hypothetical protein